MVSLTLISFCELEVNSIANVVKAADINDNLRDLKKGSLKDKYLMAKWILGRAMVMGGRLTFI